MTKKKFSFTVLPIMSDPIMMRERLEASAWGHTEMAGQVVALDCPMCASSVPADPEGAAKEAHIAWHVTLAAMFQQQEIENESRDQAIIAEAEAREIVRRTP